MDFRNEKSKIYSMGAKFINIAILVLIVVYFLNRNNRVLANKIFIINSIFMGLSLILSGTKKKLTKKDETGFFDLVFGWLILIIIGTYLITRFF
jgi:hypothetical protein